MLSCLLCIAFLIISIWGAGYYEASREKNIKIISNELTDLGLKYEETDYAVLFENDSIYLICPCEEIEGKILKLKSKIQVEVAKHNVFVIQKKYMNILPSR